MVELTIRLVASLAVVVGLLLLLARVVGKRFTGHAGAPVQVLHRQQLSRSASVAVVTVGSRVLVLGTTDQQVSLLAELDPDELAAEDLEDPLGTGELADLDELGNGLGSTDPLPVDREPVPALRAGGQGALSGSVLSPDTWRQALAAARGKAS